MTFANPSTTISCKKGSPNDPITIDTSSMGITDLRAPLCTDTKTQMTTTFQSPNATLGELTEEFHVANDGQPLR